MADKSIEKEFDIIQCDNTNMLLDIVRHDVIKHDTSCRTMSYNITENNRIR